MRTLEELEKEFKNIDSMSQQDILQRTIESIFVTLNEFYKWAQNIEQRLENLEKKQKDNV